MATMLFSYPFRLGPDGVIAHIEDGSDAEFAQEVAVLIMTEPGERILNPEYGMPDIAFDELDQVELASAIEAWGPPVEITDFSAQYLEGDQLDIRLSLETVVEEEPIVEDGDEDYDDDTAEDDDDDEVASMATDG